MQKLSESFYKYMRVGIHIAILLVYLITGAWAVRGFYDSVVVLDQRVTSIESHISTLEDKGTEYMRSHAQVDDIRDADITRRVGNLELYIPQLVEMGSDIRWIKQAIQRNGQTNNN